MYKLIGILLASIFCLSMLPVSAATLGGLDDTAGNAGYTQKDLLGLVGGATNLVLSFLGVIFLVIMMIGGYIWMTAAGNEAKVGLAIKLITSGVIGLVIVAGSYAISVFVGTSFNPSDLK